MKKYARFGAIVATTPIAMFGSTYLNTYALDPVFFSETRTCTALVIRAEIAEMKELITDLEESP